MVLHGDTICALSSGAGRAGIAVVRVSGPEAARIVGGILGGAEEGTPWRPRTPILCRLTDPRCGLELDEALLTLFPGPASYTGEDLVELSLHGNPVVVASVLDALCSGGARLAQPGEFTMRAFLNGRMDLAQAEAVNDFIQARTLFQAQVAARQRSGEFSEALGPARRQLVDLIVQLESAVEFVEEDLPVDSRGELAARLGELRVEIGRWIESYRRGRILREGFGLAVVGRPNVGKSSLFNALLERDRSIVTDVPGTTRDTVSETTNLGGLPVHLVDTAGLRETSDRVERLGVDRSMRAIADADAVLLVLDGSEPPQAPDHALRAKLEGFACVVVVNKSDLGLVWSRGELESFTGAWPLAPVSAKSGQGIDSLRQVVREHVFGSAENGHEGLMVTNLRQCLCLERTAKHLGSAANALGDGLSEEYVLADLRSALSEIGAITGETSVEDLLGEIFARFCVGK